MAISLSLVSCGGSDGRTVTRSEFEAEGRTWTLDVDEATVRCESGEVLVVSVDGSEFALNGFARQKGYPQIVGTDVSDLQEIARQEC